MPFVYIVRCADGTLYTGWAVDVQRRVKMHNAGRGARYTVIFDANHNQIRNHHLIYPGQVFVLPRG